MHLDGKPTEIGPETAIYTPAGVMHKVEVHPDEDMVLPAKKVVTFKYSGKLRDKGNGH